jgi:hypothetical protein
MAAAMKIPTDVTGLPVQPYAVYRAEVRHTNGWRMKLVQAIPGDGLFGPPDGFWVEDIEYLVSPDAVRRISARLLPPLPHGERTATKVKGQV